MNRKRAQY